MEKASWINAFVLHMTQLRVTSRRLGDLAEKLWPHLSKLDPKKAAEAEHALGDSTPDGLPDAEFDTRRLGLFLRQDPLSRYLFG